MRRLIASLLVASAISLASPGALAADPPKSPGLSKAAAKVIADRYFATEIGMEAVVAAPFLEGDNWVFPLKVGYANNVARDPIIVNRFTGKASWAGQAELDALRARGNTHGTTHGNARSQ